MAPSSSGPGRWPLTPETRVRTPVGSYFHRIRTASEFEVQDVIFFESPATYQLIARRAKELHDLGVSYEQIAQIFGLIKPTARKAVLWREEKEDES